MTHIAAVLSLEGFDLGKETLLVMDNAAVNRSKKTMAAVEALGLPVLFLPPYTP